MPKISDDTIEKLIFAQNQYAAVTKDLLLVGATPYNALAGLAAEITNILVAAPPTNDAEFVRMMDGLLASIRTDVLRARLSRTPTTSKETH
jgi:hypothetical protein